MTEVYVANPITVQSTGFLYSLFLGVILGAVYDLFRVLRSFLPRRKVTDALLDVLYWIIAIISLLLFVLTVSGGIMRWYVLLGVFGGGFLYMASLSVIVFRSLRASVLILKKLLGMMTYPLYFVLSRSFRAAKKAAGNMERKIRERKNKRKDKRKVVSDGGEKEKEKRRHFR